MFFSDDNPELTAFEEFQATYTKNDNVFMFVRPKDDGGVFNPTVMGAVAALTEGGWQIPYSIRVDSVTNFQHTYAIKDDLIVEDLIANPAALSPAHYAEKRAIALAEPLLANQLVTADARGTAVNIVIQYPEQSTQDVPDVAAAARALRDEVASAYPDLEIHQLRRVEFYDRKDSLLKTLSLSEYQDYEGVWRAQRLAMVNHQTSKETDIVYEAYDFAVDLDDGDFVRGVLTRIR